MKIFDAQPEYRDRTYRTQEDGDYLNHNQYMNTAISLCVFHVLFEFWYLWLGCIPMAIINIFSIGCYIVSIIIIAKSKKTLATIWIMVTEVFLHVIFASYYLGTQCGFHLWLFGTLASVFLPFYNPDLSKAQKHQIGVFSTIVIFTFLLLTSLGNSGAFPDRYHAGPIASKVMYYFNAVLAFGSIMLYIQVYNQRVAEKQEELRRAAEHDYLTGIYNRQRIQKILDAEFLRQQTISDSKLSVAIVDIDFFKKINDTYGHLTGDEALKELTKIFWKNAAMGMLYGRWGGEEFLLIAPEDSTFNQFINLLESIRLQVENNSYTYDGKKIKFTVSIGAAAYEKGMTVEELVNLADDRLYYAKETGRNKTVYA